MTSLPATVIFSLAAVSSSGAPREPNPFRFREGDNRTGAVRLGARGLLVVAAPARAGTCEKDQRQDPKCG